MSVPIVAFSSDESALGRMSIAYGVLPVFAQVPETREAFFDLLDRHVIEGGLARKGQPVVVVSGDPIGSEGLSTQLQVHYVGDGLM